MIRSTYLRPPVRAPLLSISLVVLSCNFILRSHYSNKLNSLLLYALCCTNYVILSNPSDDVNLDSSFPASKRKSTHLTDEPKGTYKSIISEEICEDAFMLLLLLLLLLLIKRIYCFNYLVIQVKMAENPVEWMFASTIFLISETSVKLNLNFSVADAPANWEEVLDGIRKMRFADSAPVETMRHEKSASLVPPKVTRL